MKTSEIGQRQVRCRPGEFEIRADENGTEYIEGYFAVFGAIYEIDDRMTESIDPAAFDETINDDIRCLTDHDTRLVLGRTTAGTFEIRTDEHGLWGRVLINPNDQDAVNTKARVDRRDVTQASFGFDILEEDTEYRDDGSIHFTIKKVRLYECSVCTFPAYEETNLAARAKQRDEHIERERQAWRADMKRRLAHE